ncbi:MAG: GNAT family N-acetyltransferase [Acidimicrobiales bacterium]
MVEIRFIESSELLDFRDATTFGFGEDPSTDEGARDRWLAINPAGTAIVAIDRGRIVATFGSYDLELTMPGGGQVRMAGTTHVTVYPTHRRQGILTKMMRMHLDQAHERGQPMAGLWASEERIYSRFGYGPAAAGHELKIPARTVDLGAPEPGITVHPLTVDQAKDSLPGIYAQQLSAVPGRLVRSEQWWEARRFYEPPSGGSSPRQRYVVAERDGVEVGYVIFRLHVPGDWSEGRAQIVELVAVDDPARRALWNFATNIDLFRNVSWWNAPIDDPLLVEADRFREISRTVMDSLWLRPLDVVSLLTARSYERDGAITIGITDRFGPAAGRYRLEVVDGQATCEPTTAEPDAEFAVEELGRLLLGGGSAFTLQRAGLITVSPVAANTLSQIFATRLQPHCPEVF